MKIEVEFWQLVGLLATLIGAFFVLFKMLLGQQIKHIDSAFAAQNARLEKIEQANLADATNWQRAERELLQLKAELPLNYVRRDDFVQAIGGISTRIDNFALRMERALDNKRNGGSL